MKKALICIFFVYLVFILWTIIHEDRYLVNHEKFFSKLQKQKFDLEMIKNNPERVLKTLIIISDPEAEIDPLTNGVRVDLDHAWQNYQLLQYIVGNLQHLVSCVIVGHDPQYRIRFQKKTIQINKKKHEFSQKFIQDLLLSRDGYEEIFNATEKKLPYYVMHNLAYTNTYDVFGAEKVESSMDLDLGVHRHNQWQAIKKLYVQNNIISKYELTFSVSQFKTSLPKNISGRQFIPDLELYKEGLQVIAGIKNNRRLDIIVNSVEWTFKRHRDVVCLIVEEDLVYDLFHKMKSKPWRVILFLRKGRTLQKETPNKKRAQRMIKDIDQTIEYLKK